jgi:hypothetical protein
MSNFFLQTKNNLQAVLFGLDWGWNPTHTDSALRAVEGFLNTKKLGTIMVKNSKDLNQIWLKPYFDLPVDEALKQLGVITMDEALLML